MPSKVLCFADVDLDSVIQEVHDSWSDRQRLRLVKDLCYGFEDPVDAQNKLNRFFQRELGT